MESMAPVGLLEARVTVEQFECARVPGITPSPLDSAWDMKEACVKPLGPVYEKC